MHRAAPRRPCGNRASATRACAAVVSAAAAALRGSTWRGLAVWSEPVVSFGERFQGHKVPAGLRYCPDFVSAEEQAELLQVLDGGATNLFLGRRTWTRNIRRAQQFFGLIYYQTSQAVPELQPTAHSPLSSQYGRSMAELPAWLLPRLLSEGLFAAPGERGVNQVQGNEYLEDSGIGTHVEDPAAGPTLATVSLLQPVQLTLQRAEQGKPMHRDRRDREDCLKVLLEPRSLLVLQGESRYDFAHSIRESKRVPLRDGSVLRRGPDYRRVSLTFRGIVEGQRSTSRTDSPDGGAAYRVVIPPE
ncbi:unnamed protein product [Polarella glacialis]|uniref:Alpha-ketoglutarate-dependent dioxygenase AlkB-like domain-containing protein n=1 Tax=Polarella glacialis TaxID=89957 RepID=A0A813JDV2_POLGL|nr:unnamed protein product [Polarella glacialis]